MQQVQDRLDFKIDTPSDEELKKRFREERDYGAVSSTPKSMLSRNKRKRQRKAQKKARRVTA
jgi:hypothetical protein